jgi:hypothetical protein
MFEHARALREGVPDNGDVEWTWSQTHPRQSLTKKNDRQRGGSKSRSPLPSTSRPGQVKVNVKVNEPGQRRWIPGDRDATQRRFENRWRPPSPEAAEAGEVRPGDGGKYAS